MKASATREQLLAEASAPGEWDFVIIGGGATGLGSALEAVSRGYRTLLLEAQDFAKATSSRSTKLVHGGVRYLRQGNVKLVLDALRERGRMLRNAPHIAHRQAFVVPAYSSLDLLFYGAGLTLYDFLAGKEGLGRSQVLGRGRITDELPGIQTHGLKGGILYYDGQFDDARFAITLLRTFLDLGGIALNYAGVTGLLKRNSNVCGVAVQDAENGERFEARAKVVVNATGIFSDQVRHLDEPQAKPLLTVSQGTHFVLPRAFLPGNAAVMIPKTSDGRVLFAIPWHERVVVGTTDDPVAGPEYEPKASDQERQFITGNIARYLGRQLQKGDVLSMWSGQRPLVRQADKLNTAAVSRDHTISISQSKLVTITGGKWTTYRRMAQDVIDQAIPIAKLPSNQSVTSNLRLHGWISATSADREWKNVYGADLPELDKLAKQNPELNELLHPRLPFRKAEVIWAAMHEMARTPGDVLARRTRALFLDAQASIEAVEQTAVLMAKALGRSKEWQQQHVRAFKALAKEYIWNG